MDLFEAAPTALNGLQPPWGGFFSDAQVTIDGTYDGSNGSGTLTFRVDRDGTHGVDDLKIKVYDPGDTFPRGHQHPKNDPLNTQYTLSNGLTLTLGAGGLLDNDIFTLDVAASPASSSPASSRPGTVSEFPMPRSRSMGPTTAPTAPGPSTSWLTIPARTG